MYMLILPHRESEGSGIKSFSRHSPPINHEILVPTRPFVNPDRFQVHHTIGPAPPGSPPPFGSFFVVVAVVVVVAEIAVGSVYAIYF
jgi:hypothetical protein